MGEVECLLSGMFVCLLGRVSRTECSGDVSVSLVLPFHRLAGYHRLSVCLYLSVRGKNCGWLSSFFFVLSSVALPSLSLFLYSFE